MHIANNQFYVKPENHSALCVLWKGFKSSKLLLDFIDEVESFSGTQKKLEPPQAIHKKRHGDARFWLNTVALNRSLTQLPKK